jgi:two-component system sensor histidine kinase UhpB
MKALVKGEVCPAAAATFAPRDLRAVYADALEADLGLADEAASPDAYEIGRSAMARDVGLLEMATMHHEALARAFQRAASPASFEEELRRAGDFFTETLSPYDMAYRGFRDAVSALRQLNQTMEREIQRIAHTVHDEAGPLLDAARLAMSAASQAMSPAVQKSLREVSAILDRADEELRRLSHELRPTILDDLGLLPALQFLADRISKAGKVSVKVESDLEGRQGANIETALYRVVQEALTNVLRHSRAKTVQITLSRDAGTALRCAVRDDGVGFDPAAVPGKGQRGLGLVGIRERLNAVGGRLQIRSEPGRGAELLVEIPVEA